MNVSGLVDCLVYSPLDQFSAENLRTEYNEKIGERRSSSAQLGITLLAPDKLVKERRGLQQTWPFFVSSERAAFGKLVREWRKQAAPISSSTDRAMLPSYQSIVGMGKLAIPFILEEMRDRGGHWFWALRAITGENPVPPEHRGNVQAMTEDWIQWGRRHGYV